MTRYEYLVKMLLLNYTTVRKPDRCAMVKASSASSIGGS